MPNTDGSETRDERIIRLRAEVTRLREARDNQLATGAEKRNGVFALTEVSFKALLDELRRKERELELLESPTNALGIGIFSTRGHI